MGGATVTGWTMGLDHASDWTVGAMGYLSFWLGGAFEGAAEQEFLDWRSLVPWGFLTAAAMSYLTGGVLRHMKRGSIGRLTGGALEI